MKALVIYDSVFGNTEKIARAIGDTLAGEGEVRVLRVSETRLEDLTGLDLLVVGSPTRQFRATEATTKFLSSLPAGACKGIRAAVFDTRLSLKEIKQALFRFIVNLGGYAVKPITALLVEKGAEIISSPQGFLVKESEGPLVEGELERAAAWAEELTPGL